MNLPRELCFKVLVLGSQARCHFPGSSHLVTRQLSSLLVEPETVCTEKGISASSKICKYFEALLFAVMLQIRRVSGEELAIALEEVPNVRAVKRRLNQLSGLPPCFRQRLLLHGKCLEDAAAVHPGMELEVVMLAFIPNRSPDEVKEFTAAARAGDLDKVCAFSGVNFLTPHSKRIMQHPGLMS